MYNFNFENIQMKFNSIQLSQQKLCTHKRLYFQKDLGRMIDINYKHFGKMAYNFIIYKAI